MRLLALLSLVCVLVSGNAEARFGYGGVGAVVAPVQSIQGIALSNNSFTGSSTSGTVVGALSTTMSPSSPGFSGSLAIVSTGVDHSGIACTSTNGTNFQIASGNLALNATLASGTYPGVCVSATQGGISNSPIVQAFTITGAASGFVTSFNIVNTSGSTVTTVLSPILGLQFTKGDITTWPAFSRADNGHACVYSQGLRRNWSDGSIKHLTVVVRCPDTLTASATLQVNVAAGGSQPSASARTTTELSNALINVTGVGQINLTGTWVSTLSDGIAGAFKWLDGDAGAGWIVDTDMKQSGSAHGQLKVRYYTLLTTDGSGNLGGIEFLPRVWQPLYDQDTPAKDWRGFSSLVMNYGAGPTTINWQYPYNASTITGTGGINLAAPSNNYYTGAQVATDGFGMVPVTLSGTLGGGLSTGTIYFAAGNSVNTNVQLLTYSAYTEARRVNITGVTNGTMTPLLTCLHFGSIFGADANARWQYIQSAGSLAARPALRTTRDFTYWHKTKTIPPFDLTVAATDNDAWPYDWTPQTSGPLGLGVNSTGERPALGPINGYAVKHLFHQTVANEKLVRTLGFVASLFSYNLRDKTVFAPANVGNPATTYTGFGTNKNTTLQWTAAAGSAPTASGFNGPPLANRTNAFSASDFTHKPQLAYYPYLWSGEPQFLDLVIETADGALYYDGPDANNRNPNNSLGSAKAVVTGHPLEARAAAWQIASLGQAAGIVPNTSFDGVDYKTYFTDSLTASFQWMNTTTAGTNAWTAANGYQLFYSPGLLPGIYPWRQTSSWQRGYLMMGVALATGLNESTDGLAVLQNYSTWIQHYAATWGLYNLPRYYDMVSNNNTASVPVASDAQFAETASNFSSFSWSSATNLFTIVFDTATGYVPTDGDKWIFSTSTLVMIPDQGGVVPSGLTAMIPYYSVNTTITSPGHATFNVATAPNGTPATLTGSASQVGAAVGMMAAGTPNPTTAVINANPDESSYPANVLSGLVWSKALGVTGLDTAITDFRNRVQASPLYVPADDPRYTMQSTY